jgi:hypothetical protein
MNLAIAFALTAPALIVVDAGNRARAEGCDSARHREFDFWLGEWLVEASSAGDFYRVRKSLGGCGIEEALIDGRDGRTVLGFGLSGFDTIGRIWVSLWVDREGQVFKYSGGPLADGSFMLTTEFNANGETRRFRYVDVTPATVGAEYHASPDGGASWNLIWSGRYRRIDK